MDPNNPIILTQISVHDITPPNDIPVSVSVNPPLSQATENNDAHSLSINSSTPSTNINQHQLESFATTNGTLFQTPPGLVLLHHDQTKNFVLGKYCRPTNDSFAPTTEYTCKFNRDCVVNKSKVLFEGEKMSSISPTVFRNAVVGNKNKYNYNTVDTRLVHCFNKLCKNPNSKLPKCFHYLCFQHMMGMKSNKGIGKLEIESLQDKITEQVVDGIDMNEMQKTLKGYVSTLIFPVCGKRCFNTVNFTRNKKGPKHTSDYASAQCWDNDGGKDMMSSIDVLIHWLTTEENATNYFGGLDVDGRTNSNRKETYHYEIRDLIKEENG